jgi:hypothetical protein
MGSIDDQDQVREAIIMAAELKGMSAYAIGKACGDIPNQSTVRRFLKRELAMNSMLISRVFAVLGIEMSVRDGKKKVQL